MLLVFPHILKAPYFYKMRLLYTKITGTKQKKNRYFTETKNAFNLNLNYRSCIVLNSPL